MEREIVYVGDPMCSWCWGFAPQLDELRRRFPGVGFRIVTGGLRPGPDAQPMTDRLATFLAHEWTQIQRHTGQPFNHRLLGRRDWIYDTDPACRAVAVMRNIEEPLAWPLFKRIQRAFYTEGILPTDSSIYPPLVEEIGGNVHEFMQAFDAPENRGLAWTDFALVRRWGVTSFPTVIARLDDQGYLVTIGYAAADAMVERLPLAFHTAETAG